MLLPVQLITHPGTRTAAPTAPVGRWNIDPASGDIPIVEIHLIAGTRPEAVKLAPLVSALTACDLQPVLVASGQHPAMVQQALDAFDLVPDETLRIDRGAGRQAELMAVLAPALDTLWHRRRPAAVVVQGDTTTTLAGALTAFWAGVPVVHLEAGLRSHDLAAPFPEEGNRRMVSQIAALHLPPTEAARLNLEAEGRAGPGVIVTGNTAVDAVLTVAARGLPIADAGVSDLVRRARAGRSRLLLVTVHRRESWGAPLDGVLQAVRTLVLRHDDVEVVLPAHPNPDVRRQVRDVLDGTPRILVTDPLPYPDLVAALAASTLVLSDSGGIQEEAPSFGVPVLVLREVTERMEAVHAGCALLLGTDTDRIVGTASALLAEPAARAAMMTAGNPFGDGSAAVRAAEAIAWLLGARERRPADFVCTGAPSAHPSSPLLRPAHHPGS
jgi:UDP-N-acetylglucosamine 2-epimerase (non-hydrolysing)